MTDNSAFKKDDAHDTCIGSLEINMGLQSNSESDVLESSVTP